MSLKLITGPAAEPLTVGDTITKLHLRVDSNDEDTLLPIYIAAARRMCEHETGRRLINQTWELALDAFPDAGIDLLLAPVASITSVKYLDTTGVEQTLASNLYTLDSATLPAWLYPAYDTNWPETQDTANAVKIRFVVGYGADGSAVPDDLKAWMMIRLGSMYDNRAEYAAAGRDVKVASLPYVDSLLDPYRIANF